MAMNTGCGDTQRWWENSKCTRCDQIHLNFLYSESVEILEHLDWTPCEHLCPNEPPGESFTTYYFGLTIVFIVSVHDAISLHILVVLVVLILRLILLSSTGETRFLFHFQNEEFYVHSFHSKFFCYEKHVHSSKSKQVETAILERPFIRTWCTHSHFFHIWQYNGE